MDKFKKAFERAVINIQAHQHSAGARKDGPPNEIGHSRGRPSTKIHAAVDAYGYPVYIMISEGQRNDINFAIPVLEHINYRREQCPCRPRIRQLPAYRLYL